MIRIATLLCVLAVYAQGTAIPAASRFNLGDFHIIGGHPIPISVAPYQVSIQIRGLHYCGGSIISRYHALTAAHCAPSEFETDLKEIVIHSRSNYYTKGDTHHVVKIIVHKLFDLDTMDYDVAVLKVAEPFTAIFNDRRPAKIVDISEVYADNETVVATGWGATQTYGSVSEKLNKVELEIINREDCVKAYSPELYDVSITPRMICAGSADQASGKDLCSGDVGGPLVSKTSGKQIGVFSWGFSCGRGRTPQFPAVFVNLADKEIHDFITESMKD